MIFAFGDFELDESLFQLRRRGDIVRLEPKVFDVLLYLIRRRERVVSKEELLAQLWPGEFLSDSVLPRCIAAVRKAVADDPTAQKVVQTVHGRGYRFVAGVAPASGSDGRGESERAPAGDAAARARPGSVFVGREPAMEELRAALEDACTGRGRLALLVGEPGIGKTRTAEELGALAVQRGARVLGGCCYEGDGPPAFWPWVQILRAYTRDTEPRVLAAELGAGAADLAELVPDIRRALPHLPTPPVLPPEQARFRLFDGVATFLTDLSRPRPLVVVLDDLHWADKPSLLLLQFLARELRDARLLLVGTYRDVELRRQHPLAQVLGDLAREPRCQRIVLRGLAQGDVERFIAGLLGARPPAELVTEVHGMTEGNPFFVGEIVRLLIAEGRLAHPELRTSLSGTLPQGVREAIGRRLNALSEECNRVLTLAAVIGREFDLNLLEHLAELTGERLLELLDEAAAARILAEPSGVPGRYTFSHALVRETLYEELTLPLRVRWHRRVGETLEQLHRSNLDAHLPELAHHFFQAAPAGDAQKAIRYGTRAAERATQLLAYEEATAHYERALQALDLTASDEVERCRLLLALGEAQSRSGEREKSRSTFQRAAGLARTLARPADLARAALGFGGRGEMGMPRDDVLLALLDEALCTLGEAESGLRVRILARLVGTAPYSESLETRRALSHQALELAREMGDRDTLLVALTARAWALLGPDHVEERLEVATELVRTAQETGDKSMGLAGLEIRMGVLLLLGDIPAADREIEAAARLAEEIRQPVYSWFAMWWRGSRALCDGRLAEADRLREAALALGQRIQHPGAMAIAHGQSIWLAAERGGTSEAFLEGFQFLLDHYPPAAVALRAGEAALRADSGDVEEARRAFDALAAQDFIDIPRDEHWLVTLTTLAQACASLGDVPRARRLYELLRPFAQRNVVHDLLRTYAGSVSLHLGLLARALGKLDAAARHFEDALAMNARIGRPFVARTQYEYALMLLERGRIADRRRAATLLDQAMACAGELGMTDTLRRVNELRERLAERPPGGSRRPARP
jgi:DNA-binding winged helix-turn-helix (wHTH) protein/tetratricopeptide (TPR) repeat protein